MTPSKLVNWKNLGFVSLGFCRGIAHATEGKHLGLGLALGPRAADSDDEEDYGHQQQRTRQESFLKLLLDRDKSEDREDASQGGLEGIHELGSANQFGGET